MSGGALAPAERVLIVGCGYVGGALAAALVAQGRTVHGLRRDVNSLPPGVRPVAGDVFELAAEQLPAADAVVWSLSPGGWTEAAYRRAYVDGPARVAALLAARGRLPARTLLVSSTGIHPYRDGRWVDEQTPLDDEPAYAQSFSARALRDGERTAAARWPGFTAVRFSGIYGPGRDRLARAARDGAARAAVPDPWTNRIHRDDCAGVLHHLLDHPAPPPTVIASDDEPVRLGVVQRWLAARYGHALLPPAGEADDRRRRGEGKRCRNALLRGLGYRFRFPTFRQGYDAICAQPLSDEVADGA